MLHRDLSDHRIRNRTAYWGRTLIFFRKNSWRSLLLTYFWWWKKVREPFLRKINDSKIKKIYVFPKSMCIKVSNKQLNKGVGQVHLEKGTFEHNHFPEGSTTV